MPMPPLAETIAHLNQQLEVLKAERGIFIAALEQIRSAPFWDTSWQFRYSECVRRANYALEHLDKRAAPNP